MLLQFITCSTLKKKEFVKLSSIALLSQILKKLIIVLLKVHMVIIPSGFPIKKNHLKPIPCFESILWTITA
jgi:hypothetical protein